MVQNRPKKRRILSRRAGGVIAATALAVGAVAVTATSASAAQTCKSGPGYVNCFSITAIGNNDYAVHLGIDVDMSQQDAQSFIDHPGEEFSAKLMADDPIWDNALRSFPVTWSASWEGGLSAEFDMVVDGSLLDEDWDGQDELYGRITLYDFRVNQNRTFTTYLITGHF